MIYNWRRQHNNSPPIIFLSWFIRIPHECWKWIHDRVFQNSTPHSGPKWQVSTNYENHLCRHSSMPAWYQNMNFRNNRQLLLLLYDTFYRSKMVKKLKRNRAIFDRFMGIWSCLGVPMMSSAIFLTIRFTTLRKKIQFHSMSYIAFTGCGSHWRH